MTILRNLAPRCVPAVALSLGTIAGPTACGNSSTENGVPGGNSPPTLYRDASSTHLPVRALTGLSMDAKPADIDADGDLDILIANEHRPNILLLNDGSGVFSNASDRLPSADRDSEDIGVADFDRDGDLDIVVVSEDDQINELYFNDGSGRFTDEGARLPTTGTSNAVQVADISGDGAADILIGNNGQNVALINDGAGRFADRTASRLPALNDVTQDLELGDVDADGDLDLLVGNEDRNRLLINDGTGVFADESAARIPVRATSERTREADFGDVDGDGDLDILFANTSGFESAGHDQQDRVLINDGGGFFSDETAERLPGSDSRSFEGDLIDLDGDGDLDVITGSLGHGGRLEPFRTFLNDGTGHFTEATEGVLPPGILGAGFDVEQADYDRDGHPDLYLADRGNADRLLLRDPNP